MQLSTIPVNSSAPDRLSETFAALAISKHIKVHERAGSVVAVKPSFDHRPSTIDHRRSASEDK